MNKSRQQSKNALRMSQSPLEDQWPRYRCAGQFPRSPLIMIRTTCRLLEGETNLESCMGWWERSRWQWRSNCDHQCWIFASLLPQHLLIVTYELCQEKIGSWWCLHCQCIWSYPLGQQWSSRSYSSPELNYYRMKAHTIRSVKFLLCDVCDALACMDARWIVCSFIWRR